MGTGIFSAAGFFTIRRIHLEVDGSPFLRKAF